MTLTYEPVHFGSVQAHLKPGDLTLDIGAYDATTSIIIADVVGPENTVIIEPAEANWPTIKHNWLQKFEGVMPRATFPGFLSNDNQVNSVIYEHGFPPDSDRDERDSDHLDFRWLHYITEDASCAALPRLKLDTMVETIGAPRGFTMDVEGAEFEVLKGAERTLREHKPLVWISIHPKFMQERFQQDASDLHAFMAECGYIGTLLNEDHEQHFWFFPKGF